MSDYKEEEDDSFVVDDDSFVVDDDESIDSRTMGKRFGDATEYVKKTMEGRFEHEKRRILRILSSKDSSKRLKLSDSDSETFHFEDTKMADLAQEMVYNFCSEQSFSVSHRCCAGRGFYLSKK